MWHPPKSRTADLASHFMKKTEGQERRSLAAGLTATQRSVPISLLLPHFQAMRHPFPADGPPLPLLTLPRPHSHFLHTGSLLSAHTCVLTSFQVIPERLISTQ